VIDVLVDATGVRVRDHGTGIDEADLPHVFDRFFRGANTRGQQGSGLGLAIVRQVAQQHGGSVSASNAVDGGAIFSIHLHGVAAAEHEDSAPEGAPGDAATAPAAELDAPAARP
jgi:two-component system sensor histidine kinase MprB